MSDDVSKVDGQVFLEKVANELARRFELGLPIANRPQGNIGPAVSSVCPTPRHCVQQCSSHAAPLS